MARTSGSAARQDAPELERMRETAQAVERAVVEAIERGDFDEAYRIAPGAPDAQQHVALMDRIGRAKANAEAGEGAGADDGDEAPDTDDESAGAGEFNIAVPRMFTLRHVRGKLLHLNIGTEQHGAAIISRADLKLQVHRPSDALDMFHPAMRELFYKSDDPQDLADQTHDAPNLRLPSLDTLVWKRKLVGATVTLHFGLGGKSDLVLHSAKVDTFKIDPEEGGTVVLTFTAKCLNPGADVVGKVSTLVKCEVELSVIPPDTGWESDQEIAGDDEEDE